MQRHEQLFLWRTELLHLTFISIALICREKYLNTLLQVEVMLKLWFPHICAQPVSASSSITAFTARSLQDSSGSIPPHKHRDQLHIPVKVSLLVRHR